MKPRLFQLADVGQDRLRRAPEMLREIVSRIVCRCGRPARLRGVGFRQGITPSSERAPAFKNRNRPGDNPKLCVECQRESLRRSWREAKRRRAAERHSLGLAASTGKPPRPRVEPPRYARVSLPPNLVRRAEREKKYRQAEKQGRQMRPRVVA